MAVQTLANEHLRVDYLAGAGPRLVRLFAAGSSLNLLADAAGISWETSYGPYHLYGGHRLWHAPEAFPRSYLPDNAGLRCEPLPDGVRLSAPAEAGSGIAKSMELRLEPSRAALHVTHRLHNAGLWPVELAAWAITQVTLGGAALLPFTAPAPSSYLPNRGLNLWPYTRLHDPRLHLQDELVLVEGTAHEWVFKAGYFNHVGWMGYWLADVLLIKRWTPQPTQPHADRHSNCEVFVWNRFLELETLGPLTRLEPEAALTHTEIWELYRVPEARPQGAELQNFLRELGIWQ